MTRSEGPFSFNLRLERETALYGSSEVVLERKPVLEARLRPTGLFGNTVFVEAQTSGGFLRSIRPDGPAVGRLRPARPLPEGLGPALAASVALAPGRRGLPAHPLRSVGLDGRHARSTDEPYTRGSTEAGLELTGPSFARIFEVKLGKFTKLKHIIEPRVDYSYQTDPGDLVADAGLRRDRHDPADPLGPVRPRPAPPREGEVRRLARDRLPRDLAELLLRASRRDRRTTGRDSPLDATLRVNAGSALNFDARATWDLKAGLVTSSSVSANIGSAERSLRFSYYDSRPVGAPVPSTQLRFGGGSMVIPKRLRLDLEANYDVGQGRMLEWRSLVTWEASCFKILGEYRDLRIGAIPTRDFRIGLNLKNIGSFLDFTGRVGN